MVGSRVAKLDRLLPVLPLGPLKYHGGMSDDASESADDDAISVVELRRRRDEILRLAAEHGVHDVRIFGSVAREEATNHSDVDLLVELEPGRSLLDLGAFLMDVQDLLGRRVDVVTTSALRQRLRHKVVEDAVPL